MSFIKNDYERVTVANKHRLSSLDMSRTEGLYAFYRPGSGLGSIGLLADDVAVDYLVSNLLSRYNECVTELLGLNDTLESLKAQDTKIRDLLGAYSTEPEPDSNDRFIYDVYKELKVTNNSSLYRLENSKRMLEASKKEILSTSIAMVFIEDGRCFYQEITDNLEQIMASGKGFPDVPTSDIEDQTPGGTF